jgi:hypothetical protein
VCPFVNNGDRRCAKHLTLADLAHALTFCAGRHVDCPVYTEIATDAGKHDQARQTATSRRSPQRLAS